ncbi:stage II sporulation protein D [Sporolactobacillus sp. CPB3-1]|uniref:Stage II sporulation protein D n=1 Tax=Sporolactobacillus mangiferae TaxID=2940498 RepID=A0ABT0M8R8_9BACL|nr:stage II sporulation protein D [Sporolactobacillus mangiferae]MCL1631262.1 stage II sporulation protein D [Sporolactobacillus mangiferae]
MKKAAILLVLFALVIIVVPAVVVLPYTHRAAGELQQQNSRTQNAAQKNQISISVYRSAQKQTDQVNLDEYLIGVVGSEMPAKFRIEALKAQAIAARTYIMARIIDDSNVRVTDTVQNQVYHSPEELKKIWGKDYSWKMKKIRQAIRETRNQVVTYNGKLISPVFFSTSNGQTENAGDYWENEVPYLRSVDSPWDKLSPKYKNKKIMARSNVEQSLGVTLSRRSGKLGSKVQRTPTGHIAHIEIGGKLFTGRQVREKLKLSSTDFQLTQKGDLITADSIGSGHDVGMSQYGAQGMAREGKSAEQILTYFYQGTRISKMTVKPQKSNTVAKK